MIPPSRHFVLVHGGFHGGWCYARVAELLRKRGHQVFTPTLTGLGERSHLGDREVNCSLHVQDICNVIKWEQLHDVVLCGHSYGGTVITGVADAMSERIASLVYVDASVPISGKSTMDLLTPAEQETMRSLVVQRQGQDVLLPFPASSFNVNAVDRAMVDALLTPHPFATLCERLDLSGAYMNIRKKTYVRATGWDGTNPQLSYERVKGDRRWSTIELSCGHDVMLDEPEQLVAILLGAT